MARLRYLAAEELPEGDRELLARPIHLYRAMVHAPGLTRAFLNLANQIRHRSVLDPRLREIVILKVAWITRSAYEWSHHVKIGRDFGVTDDDLRIVTGEAAAEAGSAVAVALQATREIAEGDGTLADETFAALRRQLPEDALTELLLTASIYVGLARFIRAVGIEVEADYQAELDAFPLPSD